MKLEELVSFPIDLVESLNSQREVKWSTKGSELHGDFSVGSEDYRIKLQFSITSILNISYELVNLSFVKIVDGVEIEKLSDTKEDVRVILGTVVNASAKKLREYEWDAIVYGAADAQDQRMRVYNRSALRALQGVGGVGGSLTDIKGQGGTIFSILFNRKLRSVEALRDWIKTQEKT